MLAACGDAAMFGLLEQVASSMGTCDTRMRSRGPSVTFMRRAVAIYRCVGNVSAN